MHKLQAIRWIYSVLPAAILLSAAGMMVSGGETDLSAITLCPPAYFKVSFRIIIHMEGCGMWERAVLKERAKDVLRKCYWIAFLVTLVALILGGISGGSPRFSYSFDFNDFRFDHWDWSSDGQDPIPVIVGLLFGSAVASAALFLMLLGVAYALFVSGPLEVGLSRYFIDARRDRSDFINLFFAFRAGRYMNAVKAMGWRMLFTFLWTLLLIIPGIVKGYAYRMIPYIMAENPGMDYRDAMKLSMRMTDGQKWEMFVLDLSFIGWYLLGMLLCGIGVLFVNPYYYATRAELYAELKARATGYGNDPDGGRSRYVTTV
jgi:hypothetical protein